MFRIDVRMNVMIDVRIDVKNDFKISLRIDVKIDGRINNRIDVRMNECRCPDRLKDLCHGRGQDIYYYICQKYLKKDLPGKMFR